MSQAPTKTVSPSRLARFYFHECERYLRYAAVTRKARVAEGVPDPPHDHRPVTQAILESGYEWEEEVVAERIAGQVHIGPARNGGALSERVIDQPTARKLLTTISSDEWLYQPELPVPPTFYQRYNLDSALIYWPPCRPDLITCIEGEDGLELRVIDVKASPGVKLSHRIQATIYSLILECLLDDWGDDDRTVAMDPGIWLAQHPEPELFDSRMLRPPIEQFLEHELEPLLAAPASEAPWHLYFRCEWCEWFDHCRQEMRATDSVSRVPYLTTHAKRFLTSADPPIETTRDFGGLLANPSRYSELDGCASLRGKGEWLRVQVDALAREQVLPHGGSSLAMPRIEHVRIVLTAQTEPVSGQLYAYGLYAQGLRDLTGAERTRTIARVAEDGRPDTIVELERALVTDLWTIVDAVDGFNAGTEEWRDQKSLQTYVFDTYEHELVIGALMRRLVDDRVAEQALKLLFHFHSEDLLLAAEHPANEAFFPIVVLNSVLRDRLALPAEVSYRFADAVGLLQPEQYGFKFTDNPYYAFELSNQMRSDAIYAVWYRGDHARVEGIEKEIRARLWAANSLVNGARERLNEAGALFAYPPKFRLPGSFDYSHPLLSRLAFFAQYEAALGYLDIRTRRMAPLSERVRSGDAVTLRFEGGDRFAVTRISEDLELEEEGFPNYLLTAATEAGKRASLGFHDFFNRDRVWVRKGLELSLAGITHVEGSPARAVRLGVETGPDSPQLVAGQEYVLCERFTDWGTGRVLEELREIDHDPVDRFCTLITDPHAFADHARLADQARTIALDLAATLGMTPSQAKSFAGLVDRRLELVWGPPGTGKTHFLGLALLTLAEAHRSAGLPFTALITAFTHAAIENLLRKIDELQRDLGVVDGGLALGKLGGTKVDAGGSTLEVDRKGGDAWLASHGIALLGGTVWGLRRTAPGTADVVVVDEGSQVRVPEASIAVRRMAPHGRLLVAGDDRQLPPIVNGAYPDPEGAQPLLHRSIFECLRRADPDDAYTTVLLENFRMNATLCRYPAEQVYVPNYRPATRDIANRRLDLNPTGDPVWVMDLLDPAFPLVVCVLEGVQATAENVVEAGLVASTAAALRERLRDLNGRPYSDDSQGDGDFWRHGLFVVSPHHAQIRAVRRALAELRKWHVRPFVDTVDKMQGQECDAVIVSYGVSDIEYALGEKEFIYSLNRLNVAVTRGRCKTIVFLARPLLEAPVAAFEDDRVAEGIAFMQGLWRWAEHHGASIGHELGRGASVTAYRVGLEPESPE